MVVDHTSVRPLGVACDEFGQRWEDWPHKQSSIYRPVRLTDAIKKQEVYMTGVLSLVYGYLIPGFRYGRFRDSAFGPVQRQHSRPQFPVFQSGELIPGR